MNTTPWLTVITVVKDDHQGLLTSLRSLQLQDLEGVEHVVIDSTGRSMNDAALLHSAIAEVDLATRFQTYEWIEPSGIYPAMNRGLQLATGKYIYFLNAGDTFFDASVLASTRQELFVTKAAWAFGAVEIQEATGVSVITPKWDYQAEKRTGFSNGFFPPHQGTFAQRSSMLNLGGFDISYRVAADYAMFLRLALESDPCKLSFPIARFSEGGTSTRDWKLSFREFHSARRSILHLTGMNSLRERMNTLTHYGKVWIVREMLRRGKYK